MPHPLLLHDLRSTLSRVGQHDARPSQDAAKEGSKKAEARLKRCCWQIGRLGRSRRHRYRRRRRQHSGPEFTDANERLHAPSEVVSELEPNGVPSYASRTATKQYRTAPLRGIWQHPPYFHNGSAATLEDVVATYNSRKALALSDADQADLVRYLKSL